MDYNLNRKIVMQNNITRLTNEDDIREFISSHSGEIRGLYNDGYYKMGGWNGVISAINELEKKYGVELYYEELTLNADESIDEVYSNEDVFERIVREEL